MDHVSSSFSSNRGRFVDPRDSSTSLWLRELTPGMCKRPILVKIDRIVIVEHLHCDFCAEAYGGVCQCGDIAKKHFGVVELFVFDETLTRMVVRIPIGESYRHIYAQLMEGTAFRIRDFMVNGFGLGLHYNLSIQITEDSKFEKLHVQMPMRAFQIVPLHVFVGLDLRPRFIKDVYGIVRSLERVPLNQDMGYPVQKAVLKLANKNGETKWGIHLFICMLYGEVAEVTLRLYEGLDDRKPIFALIQYAISSVNFSEGGPMMESYYNATRVSFSLICPSILIMLSIECLAHTLHNAL